MFMKSVGTLLYSAYIAGVENTNQTNSRARNRVSVIVEEGKARAWLPYPQGPMTPCMVSILTWLHTAVFYLPTLQYRIVCWPEHLCSPRMCTDMPTSR